MEVLWIYNAANSIAGMWGRAGREVGNPAPLSLASRQGAASVRDFHNFIASQSTAL
jgi:hypothetical protein